MTKENAYFELFKGKKVIAEDILEDNSNLILTVNTLVDCGQVIGQFDLEGKLWLWIPVKERIDDRII